MPELCASSLMCIDKCSKTLEELRFNHLELMDKTLTKVIATELKYYSKPESRVKKIYFYLAGVYYLTFARFANPPAHKIAWLVLEKFYSKLTDDIIEDVSL